MATAVLLAAPDEKADIANLSFPAVLGASLSAPEKRPARQPARVAIQRGAAACWRLPQSLASVSSPSFPSNSFACARR